MAEISTPLVSIGLPVYNAGQYIGRVTQALLSQDYPNLELIISDNASTDDTWIYCQELAAQDSRVRIHRNLINEGALKNFEIVFELSTGTYFMWAAHDDSWDQTYISQCVAALEQQPHAVLSFADQEDVWGDTGEVIPRKYVFDGLNPDACQRMAALLLYKPTPYAVIYGLFRRDAVKQCFPMPRTAVCDIHFLLMVAHAGLLVRVPHTLFRKHKEAKEFHRRLQSIIPDYKRRPQSVVMLGFMGRLLNYVFKLHEPLLGKLRLGLAVLRYVGSMVIVQAIPRPIRAAIRSLLLPKKLSATGVSSSKTHV